jgi:hypothetical protein
MAFYTKKITNKITCETINENLLTRQSSLFKPERRGDSQRVIAICPSRLYEIKEKGKELSKIANVLSLFVPAGFMK